MRNVLIILALVGLAAIVMLTSRPSSRPLAPHQEAQQSDGAASEPAPGGSIPDTITGPAPALTIESAQGPVTLSKLKGKVVLVDFWATWCGPCKMAMPALNAVYAKYKDRGLVVIGSSMDEVSEYKSRAEAMKAVQSCASDLGVTYPIGIPIGMVDAGAFGYQGSIPYLVMVDRKGNMRYNIMGYSPEADTEIDAKVNVLLSE